MNKSELRKAMIRAREELGGETRRLQSDEICQGVLKRVTELNAKNIFCYASYSNEVETHGLIGRLLSGGFRVSVPHIRGREMFAVEILGLNCLTEIKMGIAQPALDEKMIMKEIEAAIVPGLAFSKNLDRLGYGGGYYDRFLRENPCVKIGVCFGVQIMGDVLSEAHDVKVDEIISSSKI